MSNTVPDGWDECCLKDLSDLITKGTTPTTYGAGYVHSGIKFFRVENISSSGHIEEKDLKFIDQDTHDSLKRSQLKVGDLLVSIAGAIGRSAIVGQKNVPANTNQAVGIVRLRPNEVLPKFARYSIESPMVVKQLNDGQAGNAQVNLNLEQLGALRFYRPPLPEQQKIAAILSTVDDVIEKTRAQIDKLKDLKTGMMQELLTKGIGHTEFKDSPVGWIPASWGVVHLDKVSKVVDSLHQTPIFSQEGFPMIRVSDIKPGKVNVDKALKVDHEIFSQFTKNHKPRSGDLLVSRVGSYGVCCYIDSDVEVCIGQNTVVIIPEKIKSRFLYYSIYSRAIQDQIELEVAGSGYKALSLASIRALSIPLPPESEQLTIANVLGSIDDQIMVKNEKLKGYSAAKKALMQGLLTGKVRVKIDDKESAVA